jgi:hypothetical protein
MSNDTTYRLKIIINTYNCKLALVTYIQYLKTKISY